MKKGLTKEASFHEGCIDLTVKAIEVTKQNVSKLEQKLKNQNIVYMILSLVPKKIFDK